MDEAQVGPPGGASTTDGAWRRRNRLRPGGERAPIALLSPFLVAAFVVAAGLPAPAAPDDPASNQALAPAAPAGRERIPDGTAVRVLGRDVRNPSGEIIAQIVNVLVDGTGQPLAAVLDYGGFMGVGKRRIAVAWRTLNFVPGSTPGSSTIVLGLSRDELKSFPDHKDGDPIVVAAPPDAGATVPTAAGPPAAAPD